MVTGLIPLPEDDIALVDHTHLAVSAASDNVSSGRPANSLARSTMAILAVLSMMRPHLQKVCVTSNRARRQTAIQRT